MTTYYALLLLTLPIPWIAKLIWPHQIKWPSHQRKPFYIMEYREGQRVLKREHIVGVSVTKSQREVPVVSTQEKNKEDVNE